MTPHGNAGKPKSDEHKQKISAALKERHARMTKNMASLEADVTRFYHRHERDRVSDAEAVGELGDLLNRSLSLAAEATGVALVVGEHRVKQETSPLIQEIHRLHDELSARGDTIQSMDTSDLFVARNSGLLTSEVVNTELGRRRDNGGFVSRSTFGASMAQSDAVSAGYLMCGAPECHRRVNASDGPFCDEHRREQPRQLLTSDYRPST